MIFLFLIGLGNADDLAKTAALPSESGRIEPMGKAATKKGFFERHYKAVIVTLSCITLFSVGMCITSAAQLRQNANEHAMLAQLQQMFAKLSWIEGEIDRIEDALYMIYEKVKPVPLISAPEVTIM